MAFWADEKAREIKERFAKKIAEGKPLLVRDEKTASGRVHVGSMRGVAIHGAISAALTEMGVTNEFRYEINDFDPFDGLPVYLDEATYKPYMGVQLLKVPAPDPLYANYAETYGQEFMKVITDTGFHPNFYRASELYLSGKMDEAIRLSLTKADVIRRIYKEVSGAERKDDWLPLNVVCENCGKVSTTKVTDFDGAMVGYTCLPHAVEWALGCGHEGRVSPFGGRAKLPWKVEWPAKWLALGVDVEGAGKDHSTKGGARDVANHIARDVFNIEPPFDVPYEFFLVGGKKMSSSKGKGSSAREIADLVPPKIFRLALLGKDIMQAFNFEPEGETIPVLYDLYDRLAESYKAGVRDDYARLFERVVAPENVESVKHIEVPHLLRFSQVAFISQMPHLDIYKEAEALKGSALTEDDRAELDERVRYATNWLSSHAPEKYRFVLQETLPAHAAELSSVQRQALARVAELLQSAENPETLHEQIHALKDELSLSPKELFSAVYLVFLGKGEGPKAGWFLYTLDRTFALGRLKEASS